MGRVEVTFLTKGWAKVQESNEGVGGYMCWWSESRGAQVTWQTEGKLSREEKKRGCGCSWRRVKRGQRGSCDQTEPSAAQEPWSSSELPQQQRFGARCPQEFLKGELDVPGLSNGF